MTLNKFLSYIYYFGMTVLFIGVLMHVGKLASGAYVFTAGCIPILGVRLYNRIICKTANQRVHTILVASGAMLGACAAGMLLGRTYWVVFLLISVVLDMYASFRRFK